jgi:predicted chitinase
MTNFKSDRDGFLVGELIDGSRDLLAAQQRSASVQREIRNDVKSIARAMGVAVSNARRANSQASGTCAPSAAPMQQRDSRGRFVAGRPAVSPSGRGGLFGGGATAAAARGAASPARGGAVAVAGARDGRGRFLAGQPRPDGGGSPHSPGVVGAGLSRMSDRIGQLAHAMSSTTDNIDPTLNAAKEVGDVVRPLGRGMSVLFGRSAERKKERWYNRIWTALRNLGGDKKANTGTARVGWFGGAVGAGGGGLGGLAGSMASGLLGRGKGLLGLLGRGAGLLKRIPVLGGLISGGLALGSAFGMNDDPTKSDEENRAARYHDTGGAVGMGIGGIAGAALGSFLGPAGTVAGGYLGTMLGQKVGQAVGDWSKQLMDADLPGKMMKAWDGLTSKLGDLWTGAKGLASTAVDKVKAGANAANDAVRRATGIDVKATVGKAADAAKAAAVTAATAMVDAAKAAAPVVADAAKSVGAALVPDTVKRVAGLVGKAGSNAMTLLDAGRGAGMGTTELANFMGQNAHESAGFTRLAESLNYKPERLLAMFKGRNGINSLDDAKRVVAGGRESIGKAIYGGDWGTKNLGNTDAGDGYKFRGRGFIQLTGRPNYAAAGTALGLDLVNNPDLAADPAVAAKISAWYWQKNVAAKGAGEDVAKATVRINGGKTGLADRRHQVAEWQAKLAADPMLAGTSSVPLGAGANIAGVSSSSLPPLTMANVPPSVPTNLPKPPEIQAPPTKLNSDTRAPQRIAVTLPETTGQNVGDRALAHIVSGSIGTAG